MDVVWRVAALTLLLVACCCKGSSSSPTIVISQRPSRGLAQLTFSSNEQVRTIPLVEGHSYQLQCQQDGVAAGSLRWLHEGLSLPTSSSSSVFVEFVGSEMPRLVIMSFSNSTDGGMYTCTVDGASANIMITAGNPVVIPAAEVDYRRGGEFFNNRPTLTMFVDGEPAIMNSDYRWFFNGNILVTGSSSFIVQSTQLILPSSLGQEHSGNYTLRVNNSVGVASGFMTLIVTLRPVLSLLPAMEVMVQTNQEISVTCVANISVPPPRFSWMVNNVLVNETGNGFILNDTLVDFLPAQEIQVASPSMATAGIYRCVADNSYRDVMSSTTLEARVFVTGLLPPTNIDVMRISDCSIQVTWTNQSQVENSDYFITAKSSAYAIEIQYITGSGLLNQPLLPSASSPAMATVRFVQHNTTYMLRGRGLSAQFGDSDYSDWFGPFEAFTLTNLSAPSISAVTASEPNSLRVTWTSESDCYEREFTVVCIENVPSSPGLVQATTTSTSVVLRGLNSSTYYNCEVNTALSVISINDTRIQLPLKNLSSAPVMMYTLPAAPQMPPIPKGPPNLEITATSFTIAVTALPEDEDISHYQIIVLRLSGKTLPAGNPNTLYPTNDTFSDCSTVNKADKGPFEPYVAAEMSAADLSAKFVVGEGKTTEGSRCNSPLYSGASYTVFVRAYPLTLGQEQSGAAGKRRRRNVEARRQYIVFSSSAFIEPVTTDTSLMPTQEPNMDRPSAVMVAVPVIVVILAVVVGTIIIALVVGWLLYKRHRGGTYSPDSRTSSVSGDTMDSYNILDLAKRPNGVGLEMKEREAFDDPLDVPFEPSGAVRVEDFKDHVEKYDAKRQLLFQEEFEWISKNSPWHESSASQDERNDSKNRYSNITAFDHSRVKLTLKPGVECSDYINANYITGYNRPREYIASQGPLEQTVEDFWRMIWEQNSTTIIMLTNVVELGKIKCTQYWPKSGTTMYGDIAVTLENTHTFPDYIIRTLQVGMYKTNESRRILQFHYTKWPDYGTPKLAAPLLNFLKIVHEAYNSDEEAGPMVVHCSAGVGRSGTVLTIDHCLQQLHAEGVVNVCQFVQQMREERNYMVQTDQQYTFIHYAILEAITYGDTSFELDKFRTSYVDLQQGASSNGRFVLEDEFLRLGQVKTMVKKSSFQNRIKIKGAPQRHFHSSFHGGSTSGSIQQCLGHFLDSYNQSSLFVLMEGPENTTVNRFWEMVWDNDCRLIVMLTPVDEDMPYEYWPSEEQQFGSIKVVVESESAEHLYTCRKIKLAHAKVEGLTHNVTHYQYMGWTNSCMPRVPDFVSFFCCVLQARLAVPEKSRIMVHDTASLGPTGIFCSLFHCIQRVQIEKVIDIFQAVQYVQLQRPGCVSTLKDYVFIYDCVYEYLVKYT